jgi:C-terminal processing protease CtpA/Prc
LPASASAGNPKLSSAEFRPFKLGRFLIENPVASFSQDAQGAATVLNVVGADILKKFKLLLDYGHNRIIFEPNSQFADAIEYHKSGLFLRTSGSGDHKEFTVMSIIDNSPASEAGIQKGDILVSINGKPAAEFTLPQINEMLKQENQFLLRLTRAEKSIEVKLKPRRLI